MKPRLSAALVILMAVMPACGDSDNGLEPSSLAPASSADPRTTNTSVPQSGGSPTAGAEERRPLPAGSCSMMANGIHVVVGGATQRDGALLAESVAQVPAGTQPAPPDGVIVAGPANGSVPPPSSGSFAGGDALGVVNDLRGGCPDLTFSVGARAVVTTASTRFYGLPPSPGR
jgi:hypothetical protein